MDVAARLRGLGLRRYAPAFRDNDIDAEVLPEPTADDLIGIGVASIGHRRSSSPLLLHVPRQAATQKRSPFQLATLDLPAAMTVRGRRECLRRR